MFCGCIGGKGPCIFCNVRKTIEETRIVAETEHLIAFRDWSPSAKVHLLVIPKEHIATVKDLTQEHSTLIHGMLMLGKKLLKEHGFDPEDESQTRLGFHVPPFNSVDHLHMHVIGLPFKNTFRSLKYKMGYLCEDLARHCIKQVAEGIRYLHEERGVVHRDIKPENILFQPIPFMERKFSPMPTQPENDDEPKEDEGEFVPGVGGGGIGKVKIADFGLSKIVWDKQTMTPCGTVGYTAPEIVRDERYSKSVDMWALGCVLYTMLCGFPPFYDESIDTLTEKVAAGQYTFLSPWWDHISDGAKDAVSHLLDINPKKRYTINQFLAHPWLNTWDTSAEPEEVELPELAPASSEEAETTPPKTKRKDAFLSGLSSMKEVFDVSYAVHRMGEERAYRKENKTKRNKWNVFSSRMNNVSDEDDCDSEDVEDKVDQVTSKMKSQTLNDRRAKETPAKGAFDLNMTNATLLGRRKQVPS
ncbi:hypothetical protein CU098_008686 [Rhizopus stolonifer]|uniref:Protein kinase domain-containing protein n=1 Tax=Rhizopus stolonifer TaxID=4846 RepID=A0A367KA62_RHIST|nr:hypothetical protein CU098_008686 [Rhizopus stolonifer]